MASTLPYISREELDELEQELRNTKDGYSPDIDAFQRTILLDLILAFRRGQIVGCALPVAGVTVAFASSESRPLCAVCGKPYAEHGSFPTCATHPYTADGNCQHVIGAACVGAECRAGCVRARGVHAPDQPRTEPPHA